MDTLNETKTNGVSPISFFLYCDLYSKINTEFGYGVTCNYYQRIEKISEPNIVYYKITKYDGVTINILDDGNNHYINEDYGYDLESASYPYEYKLTDKVLSLAP